MSWNSSKGQFSKVYEKSKCFYILFSKIKKLTSSTEFNWM